MAMQNLFPTWSELKTALLRGFHLFYADLGETGDPAFTAYTLYAIEDNYFYTTQINNATDSDDFESNYKDDASSISNPDYVLGLKTVFIADLTVTWDEAKIIKTSTEAPLFYAQIGVSPNVYAVYMATYKYTFAILVIKASDVTDFEANYLAGATLSSTPAGALAKTVSRGASTSSLAVAIRPRDEPGFYQWTIVSHDYTDKTTWYQKSTQVTNETLSTSDSLVFTSSNSDWINPDHPNLYNQSYNRGSPPYDQLGLWLSDGSLTSKSAYRPVIKIDNVTQTSGYSIDYKTGTVYFSSPVSGTVTATYSKATTSDFIVTPPEGVIWQVPRVEVNTTSALILNATTYFQYWRDPSFDFSTEAYMIAEMPYQSFQQMQASATVGADIYPPIGGTATMAPSAENGWGRGYSRGIGQQSVIMPWNYLKPFILNSSLYDAIRIFTTNHTKHLGAEYLTATFYVEQTPGA